MEKVLNAKVTLRVQVKVTLRVHVKVTLRVLVKVTLRVQVKVTLRVLVKVTLRVQVRVTLRVLVKVTLMVQVKVTLRVQVKVTLRVQILCLACCIFFTTRPSLVDFRFQTVLCRSNLLCYLIMVILVDFTLVYFIPSAMACYIKVGFYCRN